MVRVESLLEEAITKYNRYRGSKATAKLIEFKGDYFKVKFKGGFDTSCMKEYFMDLIYELAEQGVESELLDFHPREEGGFVAKYRLKKD